MIKKIVCFILAILTISAASLTALAASDNKETITLNVRIIKGENKEHKNIDLVKYKDEIYVSCSDVEKITRYKYAEGAFEDSAYYSLGDKSVNFFYEKGRVTMPNQN